MTGEHVARSIDGINPAGSPDRLEDTGTPLRTLREVERAHMEATLVALGQNTDAAAQVLGLSTRQLYRRFGLLGIMPPRRRRASENRQEGNSNCRF